MQILLKTAAKAIHEVGRNQLLVYLHFNIKIEESLILKILRYSQFAKKSVLKC